MRSQGAVYSEIEQQERQEHNKMNIETSIPVKLPLKKDVLSLSANDLAQEAYKKAWNDAHDRWTLWLTQVNISVGVPDGSDIVQFALRLRRELEAKMHDNISLRDKNADKGKVIEALRRKLNGQSTEDVLASNPSDAKAERSDPVQEKMLCDIMLEYYGMHEQSERIIDTYVHCEIPGLRRLYSWLLFEYRGNYGLFREEYWEDSFDSAEGIAVLFEEIDIAYGRGDLVFAVVGKSPRLSFQPRSSASSAEYYAFKHELDRTHAQQKYIVLLNDILQRNGVPGISIELEQPVRFIDSIDEFIETYKLQENKNRQALSEETL